MEGFWIMAKELKTFRLDVENLNFLQTLKEKMEVKSLNEALNLILFFLERDNKIIDAVKENYPLLKIKRSNLTRENIKEVKNFFTDVEFRKLKQLAKDNGFSSVNKFSKFLVLSHLYDDKILSNDTINEFAKMNYLIKRIGINLNIFVKAIQQNTSAFFEKDAIDNLINRINKQVQETDNFIKEQKMFLQAKLK
jgi:hypothetical protein